MMTSFDVERARETPATLALIDRGLADVSGRTIVTSAEVVDLLLDIRRSVDTDALLASAVSVREEVS